MCDVENPIQDLISKQKTIGFDDHSFWNTGPTPGDGHCLIHAIITSWHHQLHTHTSPSYEDIKAAVFIETLNNVEKYMSLAGYTSRLCLYKDLQAYLLRKCYNSDLGDIIPLICANAFSIELVIINEFITHSFQTTCIKPDSATVGSIVVHLHSEHYSAVNFLIPIWTQNHDAVHNIQNNSTNLKYTASKLKSINCAYHINRVTRKRLFQLHLWKPDTSATTFDAAAAKTPEQDEIKVLPKTQRLQRSYYTVNDSVVKFSNLIKVKKTRLRHRPAKELQFALANVRSARNKSAAICDHVVSSSFDFCVLTETWLTSGDAVSRAELKPEGYDFKSSSRSSSRTGGGIGIMHKTGITCKVLTSGEKRSFEYVIYELSFKTEKLHVYSIYRPPYSPNHPVTTSVFFLEFEEFLTLASADCIPFIMLGDFNIHMNCSDNSDCEKFMDILSTHNLQQHVTGATHTSGHCLDLIITQSNQDLKVSIPRIGHAISDHMFVSCTLSLPQPPLKESTISYRKLKTIDKNAFRTDLCSVTNNLLDIQDINKLTCDYSWQLRDVLNKHAPLVSKRIVERPRVPWYTTELKELRLKMRKAERNWRKKRTQSLFISFHEARNAYVHALTSRRSSYFSDVISDCYGNTRKMFSVINSLCDRKRQNSLPLHQSELELANAFGNFFSDKITQIQDNIGESVPPIIHDRNGTALEFFSLLSENDVRKLVSNSKIASCALDPLPTALVKEYIDDLLPLLTHITNLTLSSGVFPSAWKTAHVVPLLKKDGLDPILKNYRPISNLQFTSKLAERAVVSQLCQHMESNFPLPSLQSAYRPGHSTESALAKVQSDILMNMDEQLVSELILIDLSAAFDTVDHQILCDIMKNTYGVCSTALQWIKSYLEDRTQQVIIGNTKSENFSLPQGVPQGSCLGPMMFTLYSSSIFSVVEQHGKMAHGYADDHQVYHGVNPLSLASESLSLQSCAYDIKTWMKTMRLKMNDAKTEYMLVGTPQQLAKCETVHFKIGDCTIDPSDNVRNLGAYFDKHMSMSNHVKVKCCAAYAQLHNIAKIRKHLDQKTTETLIHGLVHSHLDYCNVLLAGIPNVLLRKLQMVQNSAARVLCKVPRHDHIKPILKQLHWLPIKYRIVFKICVMTHKALYGAGPSYIKDMLTIASPDYSLRSTDALTLVIPKTKRKTLGDRAFQSAAPRQWNSLPCHLRNISDLTVFKKQLKTHLFTLAY